MVHCIKPETEYDDNVNADDDQVCGMPMKAWKVNGTKSNKYKIEWTRYWTGYINVYSAIRRRTSLTQSKKGKHNNNPSERRKYEW